MPAPSTEPAVVPPEDRPEISTFPPALVMKLAFPPILALMNSVDPPLLVVIVALPAVLVSENIVNPPELLVMAELAAVLTP